MSEQIPDFTDTERELVAMLVELADGRFPTNGRRAVRRWS